MQENSQVTAENEHRTCYLAHFLAPDAHLLNSFEYRKRCVATELEYRPDHTSEYFVH